MNTFLKIFIILNTILVIFMAFYEIKNFKRFIFWFFIIYIFSIFGFLTYIVFGNALKFKAKQKLIIKQLKTKNYLKKIDYLKNNDTNLTNSIYKFTNKNFGSKAYTNNYIKTFLNGQDFLLDLIKEIKKAKYFINMEFYIFSDDETGKIIANELIIKSKQGVVVNIVYDAFGSKKTSNKFWEKLKDANINVYPFFPSPIKREFFNFKVNYRNHRKIVIIDGQLAYTGGINLRNDHMGKSKHLKPWRDTQIKIIGSAIYPIENIFINDYLISSKQDFNEEQISFYFPKISNKNNITLQVLNSGPEKEKPAIYETYLNIINSCKKYLIIETPYFIVKSEMINAIKNAMLKGVNVKIIIPKKGDKKMVYGATLYHLKQLLNAGAKIYLYPNFIHSKVLITENVASIGTCNFDNRSFFLNFENTCLCYDKKFIFKQLSFIKNDIKNSVTLTSNKYKRLKAKNIFVILFYKIISKLL